LITYLQLGEPDKNWYREHSRKIKEISGPDHHDLALGVFAAASVNATLDQNYQILERVLPDIIAGRDFNGTLGKVKDNMLRHVKGHKLRGPKVKEFYAALAGDPYAVPVDRWIARAFGYPQKTITKKRREEIVSWIGAKAEELKWEPRQVQAAIWSGYRNYWHKGGVDGVSQ
jgi:hypothetical protein